MPGRHGLRRGWLAVLHRGRSSRAGRLMAMDVGSDWNDPAFDGRPIPAPTGVAAEYFAAVEQGELRYQECPECGTRQLYPRELCIGCGAEPRWAVASGRGKVHTFTVVRQNLSPPFS